MNKAVFIDRDGVINNDEGLYYIYNVNDFRLNENIESNITKLCKVGFLVIIISNQGGIGKGLYTIAHTEELHKILCEKVKEKGGIISELYFCPHHEQSGRCLCRKPDSLLLEKAIARFNIDKNMAFFIGDSKRDVEAADKANIKGILVPKNTDIAAYVDGIIKEYGSK